MKRLVFSMGTWVDGAEWKQPVSVYNSVEVGDNKETLTENDIDTDSMYEQMNNKYFEWEDGKDYYYETKLEDEDGNVLAEVGKWLSDYRKEIAIANAPDTITRYIISEMSLEIYSKNKYNDPKRHLHEGVVLDESVCLDEMIEGIYKTPEEARKALSEYETEITNCGWGVSGLHVTEYYLYKRSFNLKRAIEEEREVNSEDDFDKQLKERCFHFNAYDYSEDPWWDGEVLAVSPMNIVVHLYDENRKEPDIDVLFHSYEEAEEFETRFLNMCDTLNGSWVYRIEFSCRDMETISEEEFNQWLFAESLGKVNKKGLKIM